MGPGNPAERLTITKRLRIIGLPGHLITDTGLDPGDALLTFAGAIGGPLLERLELDVATSSAGIVVPSGVTNAQFKGVRVTSAAHEFNHPVLDGNAERFRVETSPGVFSPDYRDDPGCAVQWTNMTIDGWSCRTTTRGGPADRAATTPRTTGDQRIRCARIWGAGLLMVPPGLLRAEAVRAQTRAPPAPAGALRHRRARARRS